MTSVCPHCGYYIISNPTSKKDPEDSKRYAEKRWEAIRRRKEYLECPNCNGAILEIGNSLVPFTEQAYNRVYCSFCARETDFSTCRKGLSPFSPYYKFYCDRCVRNTILRFIFLIMAVIGVIAFLFSI